MNFNTIEKELVGPNVSLRNKVVVYQVSCPECSWKVVSYSKELAFHALVEHMKFDHREELIKLISSMDNISQVLIDLLIDPPRRFYEQVFRRQMSLWAISKNDWVSAPDLLSVT